MQIKTIIKRIGVLIFIISISQISFSQKNYLPGYIIQLNGDTVHGGIDYRNWGRNPDKISFKEKSGDSIFHYNPIDIKGFGVLDEFYASAIVETEVSPQDIGNINDEAFNNADLKISIDTTFLQTIIRGKKSLYFYVNKAGKKQFYIKQDSAYKLLIYKKYLLKTNTCQGIAENKKYINQLSAYLQDCPSIQSKLENTAYTQKGMEDLFLYYYGCSQSKLEFQKKTEKTLLEFGVLAGLSLTSLEIGSIDYLVNADFQPSAKFSAGAFFELVLPRNQRKWSLNNELVFSSYKMAGRYEDFGNQHSYSTPNVYHTTIGLSYLKLNNMLRYNYPIKNCFVYLNTGISNGFAIKETNYLKKEYNWYSDGQVEEGKALDEIRKYEQGYILGIGTKYKRFSFEIRREKGNGLSKSSRLKSNTTGYYFLLGYKF